MPNGRQTGLKRRQDIWDLNDTMTELRLSFCLTFGRILSESIGKYLATLGVGQYVRTYQTYE